MSSSQRFVSYFIIAMIVLSAFAGLLAPAIAASSSNSTGTAPVNTTSNTPSNTPPNSSSGGKCVYVYDVKVSKNPGLLVFLEPVNKRSVTSEMANITRLPAGFSLMALRPVDADEYFQNRTLPGFQGTYQHTNGGNVYVTVYEFESNGNIGAEELKKAFIERYQSDEGISTVDINGHHATKVSKYILAPGNFRYMYFWPQDNLLVIVDGNVADDNLIRSIADAVNIDAAGNSTANNSTTPAPIVANK
ncbi:hypothetical protein [Methanolapillus millepedarum]|uniref:DUF4367 domain-containing protein n=1 Tax=Methanolapillus millepedarum TaxID=3028296 RepID=A0AA96V359_9EURY|nr:hypothetical protein MsAc7_07740 [Methanosarcinaceae archaeon Ac7]